MATAEPGATFRDPVFARHEQRWATGLISALGVALLCALVGLWMLQRHAHIAAGIQVTTDGFPVQCDNATVDTLDTENGFVLTAIDVTPDLRCQIHFFVMNNSDHDVKLNTITLPLLGEQSAMPVRATQLAAVSVLHGTKNTDGTDATWTINDQLKAHTGRRFDIIVEFNRGGCMSPGTVGISGGPRIAVSSWGMTTNAGARHLPAGFTGTAHTSCDP